MRLHKHAEVIKAWLDGAEVEYRYPKDDGSLSLWKDLYQCVFHEWYEYRLKITHNDTQLHPIKQLSDEEKDNLWIELRKTLEGWLCTHWTDGAEKLPLVDLLSDQHQESIASGQAEIQGIADELMVVIERAIIKEIADA